MHSVSFSGAIPPPAPRRRGILGPLGVALSRALSFRLPRFLAVGCVGLASDALIFSILSAAGASDALARLVSLAGATIVTWRLNRRFTFAASGRRMHAEGLHYALVALFVQGFNYAFFLALRSLVPALPALAALAFCAVVVAALSFAAQALVTFRSRASFASRIPPEVGS